MAHGYAGTYTDLLRRIIPCDVALWLCAALAVLSLALPAAPAHAMNPEGNPDWPTRATTATGLATASHAPALASLPLAPIRHPPCLSRSEEGPGFALSDLPNCVSPPPKPHSWSTPPLWTKYPELLRNWPSAVRRYPPETVTYLAQHEVRQGDRGSPYVALTFDCETGPKSTRQILQSLRDENAHASFFILGRYAYEWPEIVREIDAGGHELASHSFFHPLFTAIQPLTATNELTYTEAAVARAVGRPVALRYIRFPYGGRNDAARLHAASMGYQSAFWDLDPRGWEPGKSAEDVIAYIRQHVHPGGIVIMHCGCWDDANALPGVLQAIRKRGLIPGTLSDVLSPADRNIPGHP